MSFAAATRIEQIQTMIGSLAPASAAPAPAPGATNFAQTLAAVQTPAGSGSPPFGAEIDAAAARYGVDPGLLRGLVRQESGFDPRAHSPAGAMGLTQLMPATASSLGVTDPYDPAQSLDGGAKYLRQMLDRFGNDPAKALAAYNAGPGAVERFGGVPPYAETQNYVRNILGGASA
jgi:soluble lytic murein transglycosylase-like protein